jgi:hypothetical protein
MKRWRRSSLFVLFSAAIAVLSFTPSVQAITVGSGGFGPHGEAGYAYGYPIALFGVDSTVGDVNQLDAFVYLDQDGNGTPDDLNGGFNGVTAQMSYDPLPSGLDYGFAYSLSGDLTDLFLTYTLTNNTGSLLSDIRFFSYMDAEITETGNTFFNEYGDASGTPGSGSGDANPDAYEIDDPVLGNILAYNLYNGALDNTNGVPIGAPNDVALALAFNLGALSPLDVATITLLISTDGDRLGSLALLQYDDISPDYVTFSGQSRVTGHPVPEPGILMLLMSGLIGLALTRSRLNRSV